jgi:hypothetical protein
LEESFLKECKGKPPSGALQTPNLFLRAGNLKDFPHSKNFAWGWEHSCRCSIEEKFLTPEQQGGTVATVKLVREESLNAGTCKNNSLQEQANIARALMQT